MTEIPPTDTPTRAGRWRPGRREASSSSGPVVAISVAITVTGAFPLFLTGALAVQMRADLGFSVAGLGIAAALYRASGAVLAVPLGRLADRVGPSWAMRLAAGLSLSSSLGIALVVRDLVTLCAFLMLGGASNALGQSGANLSLARAVRFARQGIAFGLKQSALPIATLLAGITVPVLALTVGWRWAFGLAALLSLCMGLLVPSSQDGRLRPTAGATNRSTRRGPLLVLALALMLSMMAGSTLSTFTVDAAVTWGISPGAAGMLLTFGALTSVTVRLVAGAMADRRHGGHFRIVAGMVGLGSIGYVLMALGRPWVASIGVIIAFGLGWGFNGLFWYAIVRLNQKTPGRVTGMVMPGGFVGGFIGPILFGYIVEIADYRTAWLVAASWALLGFLVMLLGRRLVSADVAGSASPPTAPVPDPAAPAPLGQEGRA
jgi:MFS family permease